MGFEMILFFTECIIRRGIKKMVLGFVYGTSFKQGIKKMLIVKGIQEGDKRRFREHALLPSSGFQYFLKVRREVKKYSA